MNIFRRKPAESRGAPAPMARGSRSGPGGVDNPGGKLHGSEDPYARCSNGRQGGSLHIQGGHTWRLAGQSHNRRSKNAQTKQMATAPRNILPAHRSPCLWTGIRAGQRSLEHSNLCLCRSGHWCVYPFAYSQPY